MENTETLTEISKEVGLEVNTEETKYILLSPHQNAGQNHDVNQLTDPLKLWHSSNIWEGQ
jgi:hypothetical protein